ncbi:uncharacterized protein TRUGW13939_06407 [Talaromyces rugulosus]|uniref:Uncharacterized protein n=1 Tax=Talaromyces rugulosus TaxID=121627 RepID=A0A7H8R0K8_TALRU|nr:uncharacterized protein TRUGW13939_06407 [Talaromyces rugulosus]QKX59275.1 hypothetical protein TRUGW13939_06407 [Talaromyces rugulosus]
MFSQIERKLLDRGHVQEAITVLQVAKFATILFPPCWIGLAGKVSEVADIQDVNRLEKLQKLNGSLTAEETAKLELARRQVLKHEQSWWSFISRYHHHLYKKPTGCFARQFDILHSGCFIPTQEAAQMACKSLGGCCAYSCNCCYRDRGSSRMPGVLMHCVKNCVCCSQRRPPESATEMEWSKAMRVLVSDYYGRNKIRF